jgi:hypothetical protein
MTDIELIDLIQKSNKPVDLFKGDWKPVYRTYSRLIHPDTCKHPDAPDAMSKMNMYKDLLENGTTLVDEQGDFKVFDDHLLYVITDNNRELIRKSFENFKILKSKTDKSSVAFHRYLPESMRLSKKELQIRFKDRSVPLTHQELPQVHINWLFSRMFEFILWLKQIGYVHMGLNPTTVFVVPETHGVIITNFYHMTPIGDKVDTISARYKMWYPHTLFSKKIATSDIDLELSKKIALYLLGDRSAAGTFLRRNPDVNQNVLNFLLTKHQNELDEYKLYREILEKNFEKKFYPLSL